MVRRRPYRGTKCSAKLSDGEGRWKEGVTQCRTERKKRSDRPERMLTWCTVIDHCVFVALCPYSIIYHNFISLLWEPSAVLTTDREQNCFAWTPPRTVPKEVRLISPGLLLVPPVAMLVQACQTRKICDVTTFMGNVNSLLYNLQLIVMTHSLKCEL